MEVILHDQSRLQLTDAEALHPEFRRGFEMGKRHETPAQGDHFGEATWIGWWVGLGLYCNRTAEQVRRALQPCD